MWRKMLIPILQVIFVAVGLQFYGWAVVNNNLLVMVISTIVIFECLFPPKD